MQSLALYFQRFFTWFLIGLAAYAVLRFALFGIGRLTVKKSFGLRKPAGEILNGLFFAYFFGVLCMTLAGDYVSLRLLPERIRDRLETLWQVNYVPFRTIVSYFAPGYGAGRFAVNFLGNILLFIPLGVGFYCLPKRKKWLWLVPGAFCTPLFIEIWQFFINRSVDVDDVILNAAGILLGGALAALITCIFRKRENGIRNKKGIRAFFAILLAVVLLSGIFVAGEDSIYRKPTVSFPNVYYYELTVGDELQLSYRTKGGSVAKYWNSDPDVISVDKDGLVTAKKAGLVGVDTVVYTDKGNPDGVMNTILISVVNPEKEPEELPIFDPETAGKPQDETPEKEKKDTKTESGAYALKYVTNGGSFRYPTRDDVVKDFLADLNRVCGKSFKSAASIKTGNFEEFDYWDDFFKDGEMRDKWGWLLTYLQDNAIGTENVKALKELKKGGTLSGDSLPYAASYEIRAFLQKTQYRANSSTYASADYHNTKLSEGFREALNKKEDNRVNGISGAYTLATPYCDGREFVGWYRDRELTDGPYKTVTSGGTYYGKWKDERKTEDGFFDVSYETESYCRKGESIRLNASYITGTGQRATDILWNSVSPEIATVDQTGLVTGQSAGTAVITAKCVSLDKTFRFTVTVLPKILGKALKAVVENHQSNALTVYNLGIGDGTPAYYYDVTGSVNNILFSPLQVDTRYHNILGYGEKNDGLMPEVEFVTVHYTGNMAKTADADNNADYFNDLSYSASIHFVTGRSNLNGSYNEEEYYAFPVLNEKYAGWHASGYGYGYHDWFATGVTAVSGDPETPVVSISHRGYFTVNGRETAVKVPDRNDGIKVTGPTFVYDGGAVCKSINEQGIAVKVVNGEYYLGNTYWGTQQYGMVLSNIGGNFASIGIESCVDRGSDLVHTWHVTAQLVAELRKQYGLSPERVVGHHFFAGKDCPQPLLENNQQLWKVFMDYVEAEYRLITELEGAQIRMVPKDDGGGLLSPLGLLRQDDQAHCVTYEVEVTFGGITRSVTLATIVESNRAFTGERSGESLQTLGETIA